MIGLFVFDTELHELLVYFTDQSLLSRFGCKYFLPFRELSFDLVMVFFAVQKLLS